MKGVEIMGNLKNFKEFVREEDGMGTVEVILIIVEILTYRYMYI